MAKAETTIEGNLPDLNIEYMRSLVKQYSELGQWSSALFWADAAAGAGAALAGGEPGGDDVWLLASTMLARGELHRAAHAVTSRGLHRRHLLCLGVAMRAYVAAREPGPALGLMDECDPMLLEPRSTDQTHNRALAGVLVWQARALCSLERREAAAGALGAALRADAACVEALDLLLDQHALTPQQERSLVDSLPISSQLERAEAALVRAAYTQRLLRYAPAPAPPPSGDKRAEGDTDDADEQMCGGGGGVGGGWCMDARVVRARRLAAGGRWAAALRDLDAVDPWAAPDVRVACLLELRRSSQLFAFAHTLVDAYPHSWQAWYAVGCYYYLVGKSEFARRYLSKAKSLEPGAGCVWLAYGHSFAHDSEHDQAMAAYFKAHQLMAGCAVPPLYVGVQCALLNNTTMCERFLMRAARLHAHHDATDAPDDENKSGWERIADIVQEPHVAHEAGVCALSAGQPAAATALLLRALHAATDPTEQLSSRWAPTLDALGHACRQLGQPAEALQWHERALALRPGRAPTYAAMGLCLALLGRETEAADALHAALSRDPDDVVALALLDAVVDRLDAALTEEEIPQFPFPEVSLGPLPAPSPPATPPREGGPGGGGGGAGGADRTHLSDMSMSFD